MANIYFIIISMKLYNYLKPKYKQGIFNQLYLIERSASNSWAKGHLLPKFRSNIGFYTVSKRYMNKTREVASRTSFHLLKRLLDPAVLNEISIKNHVRFIDNIYGYILNTEEGILQHKGTLLHSIFRQSYSSNFYADLYYRHHWQTKVFFVPNIKTDFRCFLELPVVQMYEEHFFKDINNILLTSDSIMTTFEFQKQSNPDMLVKLQDRLTYQEIKSGGNSIKHATRGSLNVITLDQNSEIIPFTNQKLSLFDINHKRLRHLNDGLIEDKIDIYNYTIKEGFDILYNEPNIIKAHGLIEKLLWKNIQCHPRYNRSIAFTFLNYQDPMIINEPYLAYRNKFISMLSDRTYDPNKIGDRKAIFKAMINSYYEIDRDLPNKIKYMVKDLGIAIDNDFLQTLSIVIKESLI